MLIPRYWAEARETVRPTKGRQVTLRRFGWSDESQSAAEVHAGVRLAEAAALFQSGAPGVPKREQKVAYAGAEGLPIREEVVESRGADVLTRNAYGALCLNTPDVMFIDVDAPVPGIFARLAALFRKRAGKAGGDTVAGCAEKLREWRRLRPEWAFRLYRTPAGARVIVSHTLHDPRSAVVESLFRHLDADPVFARMCRLQNCFRARVSPKPWRCGVSTHLRPRPGRWPITDAAKLALRAEWLVRYEQAAAGYASCALVEVIGDGAMPPRVAGLVDWHDHACRARAPGTPLA